MRSILYTLVIFLIVGGVVFYILNSPVERTGDALFKVRGGATLSEVGGELKEKGFIRSKYFFIVLNRFIFGGAVRAGTYEIGGNFTTLDIIRTLRGGRSLMRRVTIPEGSNIYEISAILERRGIIRGATFLRACFDRALLSRLGLKSRSFEGYLFPDTYMFSPGMTAESLVKVMFRRFQKVFREVRRSASYKNKLSRNDLVKLASLIEEEARVAKERKYISSVFHNRLRMSMKLDCDPTVRYAVKRFRGRIYKRDLESDSPYNTYRHRGLPPTPISCPGRASLRAAMEPATTNFLFFVARNDGSHYFSERLATHNRAVQKFQRGKNNGFIDRQILE